MIAFHIHLEPTGSSPNPARRLLSEPKERNVLRPKLSICPTPIRQFYAPSDRELLRLALGRWDQDPRADSVASSMPRGLVRMCYI